jgi:MFS family permease
VYILLILGVVFFILFVGIEIHIAKEPLIPPSVFNLDSSIILLCVAFGWATFGIWIWFIVLFIQVGRHVSPLWNVAMLFPSCITGTIASFVAGLLVRKIHPSWLMVISMTAFLTGTILVATQPFEQTYWLQTFISVLIMPFGMDMNFTGAMIILSDAIPKEHQGMVFSLVNMVLNYSVSIGLGVAGTVAVYNIPSETDLLFYRYAWYTGIGFSGIGLLISLIWICVVKSKPHPQHQSVARRTVSVKREVSAFDIEENSEINYHDILRLSAAASVKKEVPEFDLEENIEINNDYLDIRRFSAT